MSINFPDSPVLNDVHVADGITYTWNGKGWVSTGVSRLFDEDDMISDSILRAPTQQSAKAYADAANVPADFVTEIDGFLGTTGWQGSGLGPTGFWGSIGFTGSAGPQGADGFVGSQGDLGFQGSVGLTGSTPPGVQGSAGVIGSQGFAGSRGITGLSGSASQGPVGSVGFTGSEGAGFTGSQGTIGFTGSVGVGFTGSQGTVGFTGSAGVFFGYQSVSGATQTLDLDTGVFFDGGSLTENKTLAFSNVPTEATWTWSGEINFTSGDIDSAEATGASIRIDRIDTYPFGITYKDDGTRVYIVGSGIDRIIQLDLGTAYDISTASYNFKFVDVGAQDTLVSAVVFQDTGNRMLVLGYNSSAVYQYTLGTAWDVSTATYDSVSFSVNTTSNLPRGMVFRDNGTRMFIIDQTSVDQYSLSTAWDISSASYDSVSVTGVTSNAQSLAFNNSGTRMYPIDATVIYQYTLGTAWDLSTASYDSLSLTVSPTASLVSGLAFNNTDSEFLLCDANNRELYEYSLPTVSDISSATYNSISLDIDIEPNSQALVYNNDGTRFFLSGWSNIVRQFDLGTAYDLSTVTYNFVTFDVGSQETTTNVVAFNDDGTQMYIAGSGNDTVYQYNLGTAYDISTASYASVSFSVSGQIADPRDLTFNGDGTQMFVLDTALDTVFQYNLGTAYDISTASYASVSLNISAVSSSSVGFRFNNDGTLAYVTDYTSQAIFQYSLGTAYDISTASYSSLFYNVSSEISGPSATAFNDVSNKFITTGYLNNVIVEYALFNNPASVNLPSQVQNASTITNDNADISKQLVLDFYTNDSGTTVRLINLERI